MKTVIKVYFWVLGIMLVLGCVLYSSWPLIKGSILEQAGKPLGSPNWNELIGTFIPEESLKIIDSDHRNNIYQAIYIAEFYVDVLNPELWNDCLNAAYDGLLPGVINEHISALNPSLGIKNHLKANRLLKEVTLWEKGDALERNPLFLNIASKDDEIRNDVRVAVFWAKDKKQAYVICIKSMFR